jgi:hypothetical protein
MDRLISYEKAIMSFLEEYASYFTNDPSGIETYIIADKERKHFQIVRTGWHEDRFFHYMLFHILIKNGKVWLLQNNTEDMIGDDLVRHGIPKSEIILGFQPKEVRPLTGFGVG